MQHAPPSLVDENPPDEADRVVALPAPPPADLIERLYDSDRAQAHQLLCDYDMAISDTFADAWQEWASVHYAGDVEAFKRAHGFDEALMPAARVALRRIQKERKLLRGDDTPCVWESPEARQNAIAKLNAMLSRPRRVKAAAPRIRGHHNSRGTTRRRRSSSSSRTSSSDPGDPDPEPPAGPSRLAPRRAACTSRRVVA